MTSPISMNEANRPELIFEAPDPSFFSPNIVPLLGIASYSGRAIWKKARAGKGLPPFSFVKRVLVWRYQATWSK